MSKKKETVTVEGTEISVLAHAQARRLHTADRHGEM